MTAGNLTPRLGIAARRILVIVVLFAAAQATAFAGTAGAFELLTSESPDRSDPTALDGRTVGGTEHIFVAPDSGATEVRFYVDDPQMRKSPRKVERTAPWDFAGSTSTDLALPFDTTTLADGPHTITAAVRLTTGATQVLSAAFTVANSAPRLQSSPTALSLTLQQGSAPTSRTLDVSMSDGSAAFFSASENASWLQISPATATTPAQLTVAIDPAGLTTGTYTATAVATGPALMQVSIPVTLTVTAQPPPDPEPGDHQLLVSATPDRAAPAALALRTVSGLAYVFLAPDAGVTRVRFYLDDPTMSRSPRRTEGGAPWDFAGTRSDGAANPFDTRTIDDGLHTITASYDTPTGARSMSATFRVANEAPTLEATPGSVSIVAAAGSTGHGTLDLAMSDGSAAAFSVTDDRPWLSATPAGGSTPAALDLAADASGLAAGTHTGTVTVTGAGSTLAVPVTLVIRDSLEPDQVHLSWTTEPSTSLTVLWRTWDTDTPHRVQYRPAGAASWDVATGSARVSGTTGQLHEATMQGLAPASAYEYRVQADGGSWSAPYEARTAPAPGPADFDAVYVADTGLVGREDGLATGTQQVVDEIAELAPDLVLLGGDYAYYNTDKRYGTLDNSIDAWFNQMQPVGARSPMMVAYGNHETLLEERFEDWAPRFATPDGWSSRRAYSFDVGDVHFVSIFAVSDTAALPSGQMTWIEQDILAAKAAGKRWIVPFFHVSPFADGRNHPSNLALRAQLGPLFERLGVKLAIASHDQAYERSFPLTGVPNATTSTSASAQCYTQADGVTWVKVSPGGKLSNKNSAFSSFATNPPPAWTAVRDNMAHHYARLQVSAAGILRLETFGVLGDGAAPRVVDSFEYRLGSSCPPELRLSSSTATFAAATGGGAMQQTIAVSSTQPAQISVSDDAPWLSATAGSATPATLTLRADPAGLAPGRHTATVTVSAPGALSVTANVTLDVHGILRSLASDRSAPSPLGGRTETGRIYIFTLPEAGPTRVRFWLDDPAMAGTPRKVEGNAPWDFAGSATDGSALPFDASRLAPGAHTVTAAIDLPTGGPLILHATFNR